jgi:methylenetetrahydrofolate dehydrogenase (NADP+) / methenyltetrahydrofolate cyclohydrolase
MQLLDGKIASAAIKENIKGKVLEIIQSGRRAPHLLAILIGNNAASETYVASKAKNCAEIGIHSTLIRLEASITEADLIAAIVKYNNDDAIDGILVQLPLPKHINEQTIIATILPSKDVDGFHPINIGKMVIGAPTFIPATPYGIILMLQHYNIATSGMHCVVLGRSNIVGTPISILMSRNTSYGNCTVTLCHSRTTNLPEMLLQADIIIAAIGIPHFVKKEMVKNGAIIIDVGINSIVAPEKKSGYKLVGDVDYEALLETASAMTPVPGGVGLMTIAALLQNTLQAYNNNFKNS